MKNSIVQKLALSFSGRRARLAAFVILLATSMPSFVKAQEIPQVTTGGGIRAAIKYVGTADDQLIFKLEIENSVNDSYSIKIRDEEGNTFFEERFRDKKLTRRFAIKKEDAGELLTFIIKSSRDQQVETFQIDRNVRMIEDLVITKQ
jgi:hypothetical protein